MKALNPFSLIALAVAVGATTPVPSGGAGSAIWSTTTGSPLIWDGVRWTPFGRGAGSGDLVGPASATDNAIARYDTTTGKLVQNSAATTGDDGAIRSATNSGANAVSAPLTNWLMQTAGYTLANSAATMQKAFNTSTNGTLTLPTGVYKFRWWVYVTGMGTGNSLSSDLLGAGTATLDRISFHIIGLRNTISSTGARTGSASVTTASTVPITGTSGTAGDISALSRGMFRVSAGGTIIPSVATQNGTSNALSKAGSYFIVEKVGESGETYVGNWT